MLNGHQVYCFLSSSDSCHCFLSFGCVHGLPHCVALVPPGGSALLRPTPSAWSTSVEAAACRVAWKGSPLFKLVSWGSIAQRVRAAHGVAGRGEVEFITCRVVLSLWAAVAWGTRNGWGFRDRSATSAVAYRRSRTSKKKDVTVVGLEPAGRAAAESQRWP